MRLDGWLLDIYPCPQGMTLWLLTPNQTRHRLIDAFSPAFYVARARTATAPAWASSLRKARHVTSRFTERINLWENRAMTVLEVSVQDPTQFRSQTYRAHQFDAALRLFNSDLMLASVYCWQRVFPLARVEVETDEQGRVLELECRDNEWAIDYELPPFQILHVRFGGLSRIDPNTDGERRSKSKWTAANTSWTNRASLPPSPSSTCLSGTIPT